MIFSNETLQKLEFSVSQRMSAKRFSHTLGVVKAALFIAEHFPEIDKSELRAAALLHDIAKEIDASLGMSVLKAIDPPVSEADLLCHPTHHALIAPEIIKRDFPEFATESVLSAVKNHTTASPDMSDFDMIIFISDYVEDGRGYKDCITLREKLFSALSASRDSEEARMHLCDAVIECLENTIRFVLARGIYLHEKTVIARNALLARRPMPLKREEK
jgi:predicted HD superfamily hydrolase involved in NAD metabolism